MQARTRAAYLGDFSTHLSVIEPKMQSGTAYTLVADDAGGSLQTSSATAVVVTVPPDSAVPFPVGTALELLQYGTGQITVTAGGGVTLRTAASLTSRAQYSQVSLRKIATDEWVVSGDLT